MSFLKRLIENVIEPTTEKREAIGLSLVKRLVSKFLNRVTSRLATGAEHKAVLDARRILNNTVAEVTMP